ncbi:MAG: pyridoxamine 5'-phosphate oxidase family protein [Acidimicrobiia bacterium]
MSEQSWLEELSTEKCLHLLRQSSVGRIAVVVNHFPIILPINYRLAESSGRTWIALRTRPGNVIDQAAMNVAFEVDGLDPAHREGWSVLVRGTLHRVDADAADFSERFDPEPWMLTERDAWLVIEPFAITGRRLHAAEREWAFHVAAYL